MPVKVNRYKCGYCGACVACCPEDALDLVETWIEVADNCTSCGICAKICPVGALEVADSQKFPVAAEPIKRKGLGALFNIGRRQQV